MDLRDDTLPLFKMSFDCRCRPMAAVFYCRLLFVELIVLFYIEVKAKFLGPDFSNFEFWSCIEIEELCSFCVLRYLGDYYGLELTPPRAVGPCFLTLTWLIWCFCTYFDLDMFWYYCWLTWALAGDTLVSDRSCTSSLRRLLDFVLIYLPFTCEVKWELSYENSAVPLLELSWSWFWSYARKESKADAIWALWGSL